MTHFLTVEHPTCRTRKPQGHLTVSENTPLSRNHKEVFDVVVDHAVLRILGRYRNQVIFGLTTKPRIDTLGDDGFVIIHVILYPTPCNVPFLHAILLVFNIFRRS